MIKAKLKYIARDAEVSNKNLKENEHKALDEDVTLKMVLLLRGKVCNIPSEHDQKM